MKLMFILLPLLYIGGNVYVMVRALQSLPMMPLWVKVIASVLYWVVALSLVVSLWGRDMLPAWLLKTMYVAGSVWLVFTLYMVLSLLMADVVRVFVPAFKCGFWIALVFTIVLLACGYVNYRRPVINKLDITLDKPLTSPVKIVAVSDVHLGYATGKERLKEYVKKINEQNPDVVLIAGDLIDNNVRPLNEQHMDEELRELNAPMGVYMVAGNHEYISGIEASKAFIEKANIKLLRDSVVLLSNGLQIVGRDDRHNKRRQPLADVMKKVDDRKAILMLDHQPYQVAKKDSMGVDVQISGHTHRGQIFPMNLVVDAMYEQSHGYRKWLHSHVYVSSGLSLWGPPFRIGTRSDMAVITIGN